MKKLCIMAAAVFFLASGNFAHAAVPNQPIHWGFIKGKEGKPAKAEPEHVALIEKYGGFYLGDTRKKDIYLTFDNGYENGFTGKILDVLKKEQVPGAFFITGHYLKTAPELVKRMASEGHTIGNHSYYHPDLTTVSNEKIKQELEKVREETQQLTGLERMTYLRPPRGILSERTVKTAREAGYVHVMWSVAFHDWEPKRQKGWEYAYRNIMSQIHPGAVILLHTVSSDNADALEKVIQDFKKQGYTFKSLDDLVLDREMPKGILH